ncbi:hypothetical protein G6F65_023231 [Rhizopus arrhizus]|nr:hypothetical protein G6F65_023231 [Rhizopus arrhizus]
MRQPLQRQNRSRVAGRAGGGPADRTLHVLGTRAQFPDDDGHRPMHALDPASGLHQGRRQLQRSHRHRPLCVRRHDAGPPTGPETLCGL